MIQHIPMNIRRINFFFFCDRCNTTHHFILLQVFIVFHQGITFTLGHNEPFGRSISLNSAPPRVQTEAAARAQRRLLYKQCPTPTSNRGSGMCTAQTII